MRKISLISILCLLSCGPNHEAGSDAIAKEALKSSTPAEPIEVSLNVSYEGTRAGAFWFLDATSFIVDVTGCASGYEVLNHNTATDGASLKLYKGDQDCVAELKSFVWNAKTWTKQGGGDYSGPAPALFSNGTDDELVSVVLPTNLPDPITDAATVSFYFSTIDDGASKQIISTGAPVYRDVPGFFDAPYYRLKPTTGVILDNVTSPTNIATFTFQLECLNALASANTVCPTTNTQNQNQADMRIALVKDTTNGVLTWQDAQDAVNNAAGSSVIDVTAGHIAAPAAGFNGGITVQLDGPEALPSSKKMILIIEHNAALAADRTYSYITINFAAGSSLYLLPYIMK